MKKRLRTLLIGISAMVALGTLPACSGGSSTEATTSESTATTSASETATAFPPSAKYIADMQAADGKTMTIGIAVDGADITAYACNGVDDEAWFFGNQADGTIDITSRFRDTLTADFDGTDVVGDLTMDGVTYEFTAAPAPAPAGMYTAVSDGARASWVVRPDGSAIGVQINPVTSNFGQAELNQLKDEAFRSEVRNKRQLQQASQLVRLQDDSSESTINGTRVQPTVVNGNFRF